MSDPGDIIREALREYVGDGEGVDEGVLFDFLDGIATHLEEMAELESLYACRAMHEAAQIVRRYANG